MQRTLAQRRAGIKCHEHVEVERKWSENDHLFPACPSARPLVLPLTPRFLLARPLGRRANVNIELNNYSKAQSNQITHL